MPMALWKLFLLEWEFARHFQYLDPLINDYKLYMIVSNILIQTRRLLMRRVLSSGRLAWLPHLLFEVAKQVLLTTTPKITNLR